MITINLNPEVETHLRVIAAQAQTSADEMVCRIISEYVEQKTHTERIDAAIPPITKSLIGIIKQTAIDEADYQRYLQDKYL
ncbi:DUF6364 family protein [Chromatium okenii]|nr:DUF6364 family protein [Chromatium okenii]MBV5310403.1 hypothetical protein [Chromatium okenii]